MHTFFIGEASATSVFTHQKINLLNKNFIKIKHFLRKKIPSKIKF